MRTVYRPLLTVRLRHSFYASGQSLDDFRVLPAAATGRLLARSGLVLRELADGLAVYAEVEPDAFPHRLLRPLGADGLELTFLLMPANPHLWNISELPDHRPGASVFCFDNLRDDQADGRLHLGDSLAGARVGEALELVPGGIYTHRFAAPASAATITLTDRFGNAAASASFALDGGETTTEYRFDLDAAGLPVGRYAASDDLGGSAQLYYDPKTGGLRPFGVIEIYSRTDHLTPGGVDTVPPAYRFLSGEELTGAGDYHLQLDSRATTWRYHVLKKYSADGFQLDQLEITGDVAFTRTLEPERAVFTSTAAVPLAERRRPLALTAAAAPPASPPAGDEDKLRDLPSPAASTPLAAGGSPPDFISEMYVYV